MAFVYTTIYKFSKNIVGGDILLFTVHFMRNNTAASIA